jgi:hypothetical protein
MAATAKLPAEVTTGFFLANLSGAAERSETFEADRYLPFCWRDPRLAFAGTEPKRFLEESAVEQLQKLWWPQPEFINTAILMSPAGPSTSLLMEWSLRSCR